VNPAFSFFLKPYWLKIICILLLLSGGNVLFVHNSAAGDSQIAAIIAQDRSRQAQSAISAPIAVPTPKPAFTPEAAPGPAASFSFLQEIEDSAAFPRFGDRKPHIWLSRRKPWHYAIHGTDISRHNKTIDWGAVARGHVSFVFIKATEGGDHVDPNFAQNWQAAKAAGIARGAYHFYYFCRPVKDQLRWFIHNVPKDKTALPPVLDIEWNHKSPTCRRRPAPAAVHKDMRLFLQGVEKYYGKKPIIYTTVDFFHDNNLKIFKTYPFWLRSVADHPDTRYNKHPWLFWQYTGTGRVPGIAGDADISVFAGNSRQWQDWLQHIRQ